MVGEAGEKGKRIEEKKKERRRSRRWGKTELKKETVVKKRYL